MSLGQPEALQAPGTRRAGPAWAPAWLPGCRRVSGELGSLLPGGHVTRDAGGRARLVSPLPLPRGSGNAGRLPPPGPPAGTAAMAEHTQLPLQEADGAGSPHREAAAGGARGPGEAHLKGLLWRVGGSPSSAGGFLTPHVRRTALPGEAAPRTTSPRPPASTSAPVCLPRGRGSDHGGRPTATSRPEGAPSG